MHFERHFAFQNAQNYIFSRKPEKRSTFHKKTLVELVYPKHRYFFIWPYVAVLIAGNLQKIKPVQNCTGFIFCKFPAMVQL